MELQSYRADDMFRFAKWDRKALGSILENDDFSAAFRKLWRENLISTGSTGSACSVYLVTTKGVYRLPQSCYISTNVAI